MKKIFLISFLLWFISINGYISFITANEELGHAISLKDAYDLDRENSLNERMVGLTNLAKMIQTTYLLEMKVVTRVLGINLGHKEFEKLIPLGDVTYITTIYNMMIDKKLKGFHNFTFTSTDYWIFNNEYYFSGFFMQPDTYDDTVIYFVYIYLHSRDKNLIVSEISDIRQKITDTLSYTTTKAQEALQKGYNDLITTIENVTRYITYFGFFTVTIYFFTKIITVYISTKIKQD